MKKKNNITGVSALITENCNLRCKYCFEAGMYNKKVMSDEVIKATIDFLIEGALDMGNGSIFVSLFGGEPTLHVEKMRLFLEYGTKRVREVGLKLDMHLTTNGVIFTEEYKQFLLDWREEWGEISVQLSVDGAPESQDKYRVFESGAGSSRIVEENITKYFNFMQENKIDKNEISIHGCVNKFTLPHLFENYSHFRKLGFDSAWFMLVHSEEWDEKDQEIYREELLKLKDFIVAECVEKGGPQFRQSFISMGQDKTEHPGSPCGAGKSYCSVTTDGDVYPCHGFFYADDSEKFLLGNVLNEIDHSKRQVFIDYDSDSLFGCDGFCSDCDNYSCYRCIADNYKITGNMFIIPEKYCEMSKIENEIDKMLIKELEEIFPKSNKKGEDKTLNTEVNEQLLEVLEESFKVIDTTMQSFEDRINSLTQLSQNLGSKIDSLFEANTDVMILLLDFLASREESNSGK